MKKQLLFILLSLGIIQFTSAQVYKKGNMSLFFGVGASNALANTLSSVGEGASNTFGPYIIGYQYHLTDKLTIGRNPKNEIFLDDVTVSRKHAQILRTGNEFSISDMHP